MNQIRRKAKQLFLLGAYSAFFWGFLYPEFSLTEGICALSEEEMPEGMEPEEWERLLREAEEKGMSEAVEEALSQGHVEVRLSFWEGKTWN